MQHLARRHAVAIRGSGEPTIILGPGIGVPRSFWDSVVAALAQRARVITFAPAGSMEADPDLLSPKRHASVTAFADDLVALVAELEARGAVYVGHSLSAMAGALACIGDAGLFGRLVLVNASACYVDDPSTGYQGGMTADQVAGLLSFINADYDSWIAGFGPLVMGNADRPELARVFVGRLRDLGAERAAVLFRAAFTSDYRRFMGRISTPTLIVQSSDDPAVPPAASQWLADHIPGAELRTLKATGHFPMIVDPDELVDVIEPFVFAD